MSLLNTNVIYGQTSAGHASMTVVVDSSSSLQQLTNIYNIKFIILKTEPNSFQPVVNLKPAFTMASSQFELLEVCPRDVTSLFPVQIL